MEESLLLLGGNLGDVSRNMDEALKLMRQADIEILRSSANYRSESWGYSSENQFLNRAVLVKTSLTPNELMNTIKGVEESMGRTRSGSGSYEDRAIDIDILLFGDSIVKEEDLEIPHPRMHRRKFALKPASEVAGDWSIPGTNMTIDQMLFELNGDQTVEAIGQR